MKRILLFALANVLAMISFGQLIDLEFELVYEHPDMDIIDPGHMGGSPTNLDGYKTWILYANLTNEDDFVNGIIGDLNNLVDVSLIDQDGEFWHHDNGAEIGPNIDAGGVFPLLQYDTHVTVGTLVNGDVDPACSFFNAFDPDQNWVETFTAGEGFQINTFIGGGWFISPETVNGVAQNACGVAGEDLRVPLGTFTANTDISAILTLQVYPNGILPVDGNYSPLVNFMANTTDGDIDYGCTDPLAENFDEDADVDDGSCIYPCAVQIDTVVPTAVSCFGLEDGTINISEVSGGQGTITYSLDNIDFIPAPFFSGLASGDTTVYVMDDEGCTDNMMVTVGSPEEIVVDITNIMSIACNGGNEGSFEAVVSGTQGGYFTSLIENDFSAETSELMFSELISDTYTVYVQDDSLCVGESSAVLISQPNAMSLTVNTASNATCGDAADGCAAALATGGQQPIMYSIADFVEPTEDNELCGLPAGNYQVMATDANGCTVTSTSSVVISAPPAVGFNIDEVTNVSCPGEEDGEICVDGFGGNSTYVYSFGGCDDFTNFSGCFDDLAAGDYVICVESDGCTGSETITVGAPDMITYDSPIEVVWENGTVEEGEASLEVTGIAGGTGAIDVEWIYNNGGSVSNDNPLTGAASDSYVLTLTDEEGCEVGETVVVDNIIELGDDKSISLFPNPSTGLFNIEFSGLEGTNISFDVINSVGQIVESRTLNAAGLSTERLDLTAQSAGIYFANINIDGEFFTLTLIKK